MHQTTQKFTYNPLEEEKNAHMFRDALGVPIYRLQKKKSQKTNLRFFKVVFP